MKKVILFLAVVFASAIGRAQISLQDQTLVEKEIISLYSQGQGEDRFSMTADDIWGYRYESESRASCPALVSAYANKPSYHGPSMHRVYACIKIRPDGVRFAELVDDIQIGD